MDNMDNNNIEKPQADKSKKTKIIIAIVAGALIVAGAVALIVNNIGSDDTQPVVETEIATDADGTPTVVQGTTPNGTIIENGTYPDGTSVEFATTASGEYATEADGSYIINYVETATLAQGDNSANDNANNNDKKDNDSNSSSSSKDSGSSKNSSSKSDSSSKPSSSSTNNSSKVDSSSSSSGNSSSDSNNNSSSNSSTNSSSSSSSSSTGNSSTTNGDAKATINGSSYNVGDKIRVSYYMQSSVKFCGIQCDINYNSDVLALDDSSVVMENLAGPMCNTEIENQIKFLSSAATAVNDFSTEKLLFSCEYEVVGATTSDVTLNVVDILDNDVLSIPSDKYSITAKVEKI